MAGKMDKKDRQGWASGPFGPRNLAEVYQAIKLAEIADAQRARITWALEALAYVHRTVDGEPVLDTLARIPANVPLLRSYLKKAHAVRAAYAAGTWRNVRGLALTALRVTGVQVRQGRGRIPLPPEWQVLVDALNERQRMVLYPYARWNVEHGRAPTDVSQSVFDQYGEFLEDFDGRVNPRATYLAVCRAWNSAGTSVAGWPPCRVRVLKRYDHYILEWDAFAISFAQDVDQALHAAMYPDPLEPRRRQRINSATASHQRYQLRRLASALCAQTGRDPMTIVGIADLVDPTAAREALRFLTTRAHQRQIARARQDVCKSKKG